MKTIGPNLVKRLGATPFPPLVGGGGNRFFSSPAPTNQTTPADSFADTKLSYVSYESPRCSGQTPLIIHHNLFGRKENFRSLGKKFHHLTARSVIIPDARNHGNSPTCLNPSLKQMSSDLVNLSSQLGVEKACLLGHATGGRVGMLTALTTPQLVDRLVVVSSSPMNTTTSLARWDRFREACYIVNTILRSHSMHEEAGVELTLEVDSALKDTLVDRAERALFLSNLGKINTEAFLNNPDMGKFPTLQGNTFNGPTLFITGEKKPSWECDTDVRTIRQLFPNSHFVKIPGAGHWVHTEKKDDFLAAAVTFLQTEF